MHKNIALSLLFFSLFMHATPTSLWAASAVPIQEGDDAFLEKVSRQTFRYFLNEYHPETGLINDNASNVETSRRETRASIAATGFGATAFVIGAERGWMPKKEAYERILTAVRFFDERAETEHGFFYHFLDGKTGKNVGASELSSIDTAILLAGFLTAAEYFPDTELARRVDILYRKVDFDWMRNGTPFISMGRTTDGKFLSSYWSGYDEGLLIYILAAGSPTHAVSGESWSRAKKNVVERDGETFVFAGPLFIHQYPQIWLDLRNKNDGFADYFENSVRATRAQKRFAEAARERYDTYRAGFWGLSATDSAGGYRVYAAEGEHSHDGTVSPVVSGASIMFTPKESIEQLLKTWREHKKTMWGRYGFADAMNLDHTWYSKKAYGINVGPLLAAIENHRSGLVWKLFMKNEFIKEGLKRSGFVEGTKSPETAKAPLYAAVQDERAVTIDGALDDWIGTEAIMLNDSHIDYGAVTGAADLGADIRFRWNDTYLYLAAQITDDRVLSKRSTRYSYKDDVLELFFDLDGDGFRWKNARDPQLGFSFDPKTKKPRVFNWGAEEEITLGEKWPVAMKEVSGGYLIEAAIPWTLFGITPSNPLELFITPAAHDFDGEGEEAKLSWYFRDRGSEHGVELGKIRLKNSLKSVSHSVE